MKTLDEHLKTATELYSFTIEFTVARKRFCPAKSYGVILDRESPLRYVLRTGHYELEGIPEPMCGILSAAEMCPGDAEFRKKMESLRSGVLAFAREHYETVCRPDPLYGPGESFRYASGKDSAEVPPGCCILHMTNGLSPKSFLNDPDYVVCSLLRLLDRAERGSGYSGVYTFSWLNSNPRFLAFFPKEWRENLGTPNLEIYANLGFLGQSLDGLGELNRRNADEFLKTGKLPYPPRASHCSAEALKKHLENYNKG